jgi:uncharacterized protein (DUF2225 family)
MSNEDVKVSYISKDETVCPVCNTWFHREELLSGGGRMIAGCLTDELHRHYEPSVKYGLIYPLAYQATVCPDCWYASMDKDFSLLPDEAKDRIWSDTEKRKATLSLIFPSLDFNENRNLISGTASQYLAMICYDYFTKQVSPTIKQGIAALRTGWLFDELHDTYPGQHYDWLALLFKQKALFFYTEALEREQSRRETFKAITNFGPDTDKNYGYEGVLYLTALLRFKYGSRENSEYRAEYLGDAKRTIARIFGVGKSSKSKPGPLLEHARNIYAQINQELNEDDD